MSLSPFPILTPDPSGGVELRMLYVFTFGGESHVSCIRPLTREEYDALVADWPGYLDQRKAWLEWARAYLRPPYQPGSGWRHKWQKADVDRILDFQT